MSTTTADLQDWLRTRVAGMLERDPAAVSVTAPFTELGISSLQGIELSGDLEDHLGRTLSPTVVFDYPSIDALADGVLTEGAVV